MIEYGYIEDGYLRSKFLKERIERRTNNEGEIVESTISIEMQVAELKRSGWKPVDPVDDDRVRSSNEFSSIRIVPFDNGDKISYNYVEQFDSNLVNEEIRTLKKQLDGEDYKIIKCYEASLIGEPAPYDVLAMHKNRQVIRDKINELENLLQ